MNKELFSFLSLFVVLSITALNYSSSIQTPIIIFLNNIKTNYHGSVKYIEDSIDTHISQAQRIMELEEEIQKYENNHLVMQQLANEIKDLFEENNSPFKSDPRVELVRSIAYEKFGDFNRVWIDMNDFNSSKIYGLTYKELVAGIVISQNGLPLALLNKDIKSSYAVYVGNSKAPGIAHGNNSQNILVKFIPTWFDIQEGDEIITSGLDKIFFKGLKVGRVISVTSSQGYQNAIVEPYFKANELNYFHIIRSLH
ncbi:MAG: rod shape-determining protein MreC [Campylobacterota bacterium]|nr:rod shape-determining protein MreC [Campylobacterota bacterium]